MPLLRFELRNEYGLGAEELYVEVSNKDPKEILDGVTVAGLVGILRQLGDLTEFAAQILHSLQEEIMMISSRSRKLKARTKRIEAAFSPLEKTILSQRSHLHFAYTNGSNWHARIMCGRTHFSTADLPQFIMNSYEDCCSPPCLHLLDRFDPGGPGSCLKRYSDHNFFRRTSAADEKAENDVEGLGIKKLEQKKSSFFSWNRKPSPSASSLYQSGSCCRTQENRQNTSQSITASLRSQLSNSPALELRDASTCIESDLHPSYSMETEDQESRESISSPVKRHYVDDEFLDFIFLQEKVVDANHYFQINLPEGQVDGGTPLAWDEKTETIELAHEFDFDMARKNVTDRNEESFSAKHELKTFGSTSLNFGRDVGMNIRHSSAAVPTLESNDTHFHGTRNETDNYLNAMSSIGLDSQANLDSLRRPEADDFHFSKLLDKAVDNEYARRNFVSQSSYSESDILATSSMYIQGHGCNPSSASPKSSPVSYNCTDQEAASSSEVPMLSGTRRSPENQKAAACVISPRLRMEGGSLGLGPLKSLNINAINAIPEDHMSVKTDNISMSSQHILHEDRDTLRPNPIGKLKGFEMGRDSESSTCLDLPVSGTSFRKPSWNIPSAHLGIKLRTASCSIFPNNASSTQANVTATSLPANSMFQTARKFQEISRSSSRLLELGSSSNITGPDERLFHAGNENACFSPYYRNSGCFGRKFCQNDSFTKKCGSTKDNFVSESPMLSPSSPPLVHMKVSFQPIDGFKTPKVKLKFHGGRSNHEAGIDSFPSYLLVPEVSSASRDISSDSGDDNFCKSVSSLPNDYLSNQSDSSSEHWELGDPE